MLGQRDQMESTLRILKKKSPCPLHLHLLALRQAHPFICLLIHSFIRPDTAL